MNTNPITLDDLKAYNEALYTFGNITPEQQTLLDRLAPVNLLAHAIEMIEQRDDTLTAQSRLLALAETLANTAGGHLSYGDDARFTKLTLDALCDALVAYEAARTEYQTTGTVPCGEPRPCDPSGGKGCPTLAETQSEIRRLEGVISGPVRPDEEPVFPNEFADEALYRAHLNLKADNADLRRQLAEAESQRNKAWADGATLTAEMLDVADLLDAEGSSIGNDLRKVANEHSPGAPLLEELAALRETEGVLIDLCQLKAYKDDCGKDEFYQTHQPQAWKAANEVLNTLCAIRNRKEPANG